MAGTGYAPGVRDRPAEKLPVTTGCAGRAIGLPFWQDLSDVQLTHTVIALRRALAPARNHAPHAARTLVDA